MKRRHKYHARPITVDGMWFASTREAKRWSELSIMFRAGLIINLERQPKYDLHAKGGKKIGRYVDDFSYLEVISNLTKIEDVKGFRTAFYKWKRKHFIAEYGMEIIEI